MTLSTIVVSEIKWTQTSDDCFYRIWKGHVYRKTLDVFAYGGYKQHRVLLGTKLSKEWINQ